MVRVGLHSTQIAPPLPPTPSLLFCLLVGPLQKSLATSNIINKMRASNLEANRQRGGRQTQLLDNPVHLQANGT